MTNQITKEQLIRVKILPQLESVSDFLLDCHDNSTAKHFGRKLDKITEELVTILNEQDTLITGTRGVDKTPQPMI